MYVIAGATGHVGKQVANRLLEKGEQVRVVGRSADRLKPLADKGAKIAEGSLADIDFLTGAYEGATAIFHMTPSIPTTDDFRGLQNKFGEAAQKAIQAAEVLYVVNISSVGAHLGDGVGPVNGLYDVEQLLDETDANILHLRPTYFMENAYQSIPTIKANNMIALPLRADLAIPMIATRDIGNVAADLLMAHDWEGINEKELLGPKDYSGPQVAEILGKALNRPVTYVQAPPEQVKQGMMAAGLSENVADTMLEMYEALNLEVMVPTEMRNPNNATPTTFEEFAKDFVKVFNAQ